MKTTDVQILFADLQPSLVAGSRTVHPDLLSTAAGALARAADVLNIPMTFSIIPEGGEPGNLIPQLLPYANKHNTYSRTVASPFLDEPTSTALLKNERKVLVIAGFSSEVVVLHASLDALAAGYAVQVPLDVIGGRSQRTESAILSQIERAGGVTTSVLTLITRLEPDLSCPPGSTALAALQMLRVDI